MKKYLLILLVIQAGCRSEMTGYFVDRAIGNMMKVTSFRGVVEERKLLDGETPVRTEVYFAENGRFTAVVLAPVNMKGNFMSYTGTELLTYYGEARFGVLVKGIGDLFPPNRELWKARIRSGLERAAKEYRIEWVGYSNDGGRDTHRFTARPEREGGYRLYQEFCNDVDFSMPLRIDLFRGREIFYSMRYETARFNVPVADNYIKKGFPRGTMVARWDLGRTGLSITQLKSRLNFRLYIPGALPGGIQLKKAQTASGIIPAACLIYSDGLFSVIIYEIRDYGLMRIHPRGVCLPDIDKSARMNFAGEYTTVSLKKGNVLITVTGNVPYYDIIEIASKLN